MDRAARNGTGKEQRSNSNYSDRNECNAPSSGQIFAFRFPFALDGQRLPGRIKTLRRTASNSSHRSALRVFIL